MILLNNYQCKTIISPESSNKTIYSIDKNTDPKWFNEPYCSLLDKKRTKWNNYLIKTRYHSNPPSYFTDKDIESLRWTDVIFRETYEQPKKLYFLTLTYKTIKDREFNEEDINQFFKNFYNMFFLKYLLISPHKKRDKQPVTLAFLEDHKPIFDPVLEIFSTRMHHHAIIILPDNLVDKIEPLLGNNTIPNKKWCDRIMTSDLKICDENAVIYASKSLNKYPDFMIFPDYKKYSATIESK